MTLPASTKADDPAHLRRQFTRFLLEYQFGIDEITTKIGVLEQEFLHLHDYNPIEHVRSRLKSPESILAKVARRGCDPSFDSIRRTITDIAGVRVTCSFVNDVYRVQEMLTGQEDVTVLAIKDYIAAPKPNGYRSLHAIVEVPVFLSDGVTPVTVELQLRTVAMDFWASLEHKIHYKYDRNIPADVARDLTSAADTAHELDTLMEALHRRVHVEDRGVAESESMVVPSDDVLTQLLTLRDRLEGGAAETG